MKRSEQSIQRAVVDYAKSLGWRARKRSTSGRYGSNGEPDYEFMRSSRQLFFIEFKAEGKEAALTALQKQRIKELVECGWKVYVCSSVFNGKLVIDHETAGMNHAV